MAVDGAAERAAGERRQSLFLAWHIAALPLTKKFPKLADLLGPLVQSGPSKRKTTAELRGVMSAWKFAIAGTKAGRKGKPPKALQPPPQPPG